MYKVVFISKHAEGQFEKLIFTNSVAEARKEALQTIQGILTIVTITKA